MWAATSDESWAASGSASVRRTRRRRRADSPLPPPQFGRTLPVYGNCGDALHVCGFCQAVSGMVRGRFVSLGGMALSIHSVYLPSPVSPPPILLHCMRSDISWTTSGRTTLYSHLNEASTGNLVIKCWYFEVIDEPKVVKLHCIVTEQVTYIFKG